MNDVLCYINDNKFIYKNKKRIEFNSNSIKNGNIIDKKGFILDYIKNIKLSNIFSNKVKILLNKDITEKDIMYYSNIFEDLNYNKIQLLSTKKYLENDVMIYNKSIYIIYTNNEYYYIYPNLLNNFLDYNNIKKLKIISNIKINDNPNCKYYYYANSNEYFI